MLLCIYFIHTRSRARTHTYPLFLCLCSLRDSTRRRCVTSQLLGSRLLSALSAVGSSVQKASLAFVLPRKFLIHSLTVPSHELHACLLHIHRNIKTLLSFLLPQHQFSSYKKLLTSNVLLWWYNLKCFLVIRHWYFQQRGLPHRKCQIWNLAAVELCSLQNPEEMRASHSVFPCRAFNSAFQCLWFGRFTRCCYYNFKHILHACFPEQRWSMGITLLFREE